MEAEAVNRFRTLLALVILGLSVTWFVLWDMPLSVSTVGIVERSEGNDWELAPPTSGAEIVEVD